MPSGLSFGLALISMPNCLPSAPSHAGSSGFDHSSQAALISPLKTSWRVSTGFPSRLPREGFCFCSLETEAETETKAETEGIPPASGLLSPGIVSASLWESRTFPQRLLDLMRWDSANASCFLASSTILRLQRQPVSVTGNFDNSMSRLCAHCSRLILDHRRRRSSSSGRKPCRSASHAVLRSIMNAPTSCSSMACTSGEPMKSEG